MDSRCNVKDDGVYTTKGFETTVEILKYSIDGKILLWKSKFPHCQTKDPHNEMLFHCG
jgi:hypothetical protein